MSKKGIMEGMEFFYYAMPDKAKKIRDRMQREKRTSPFNR